MCTLLLRRITHQHPHRSPTPSSLTNTLGTHQHPHHPPTPSSLTNTLSTHQHLHHSPTPSPLTNTLTTHQHIHQLLLPCLTQHVPTCSLSFTPHSLFLSNTLRHYWPFPLGFFTFSLSFFYYFLSVHWHHQCWSFPLSFAYHPPQNSKQIGFLYI